MDSIWTQFGSAMAAFLFHPDYESGRWSVYVVDWDGRRRRRICPNKTTAEQWAARLDRAGFRGVSIGRTDPLPGFPQ